MAPPGVGEIPLPGWGQPPATVPDPATRAILAPPGEGEIPLPGWGQRSAT
ncbi:MAG: hypothetical protein AB7J86_15370 [Vulcanimicrobiota bacterium]